MKRCFFIFLILLISCSVKDGNKKGNKLGKKIETVKKNKKYTVEDLFKYVALEDLEKIEEVFNSGVKIKSCKNYKKITKIVYQLDNKKILNIFHKHNYLINSEKYEDCCINPENFNYDNVLFLYPELDFNVTFEDFKRYLKIRRHSLYHSKNYIKKWIKKFKKEITKKEIINLICLTPKTKWMLEFWETVFENIDYNWNNNKKDISIFACFAEGSKIYYEYEIIDFNAIKYLVNKGGKWNEIQGENLRIRVDTNNKFREWGTPFSNFLSRDGLTLDMIKYAIKTGAKWDIIERIDIDPFDSLLRNQYINYDTIEYAIKTGAKWNNKKFLILLNNDKFSFEILKFAIKTGAKWDTKGENPFQTLLKKKTLTFKMLKYAVETGAKWDLKFHYTPFSDLVLNPNTDLKMVKFALKTGAKIENISELLISRVKKEEVRDYLMKLKKESLKK